jgi:hypothetical protein
MPPLGVEEGGRRSDPCGWKSEGEREGGEGGGGGGWGKYFPQLTSPNMTPQSLFLSQSPPRCLQLQKH